ncbi:MAG: hypothetical protein CM1200mP24_10430 [Gammaproteobacteria bacterium]|nr:MAG: hypothetical protein CM1200mP24_10430 [Gammaproteobacteria bacterium]
MTVALTGTPLGLYPEMHRDTLTRGLPRGNLLKHYQLPVLYPNNVLTNSPKTSQPNSSPS